MFLLVVFFLSKKDGGTDMQEVMLIFSGTTLPYEIMPDAMQKVISIFPMTQGIQLMKAAFLGASVNNIRISIIVMVVVTAVCTGIAAKCFKWE